MGFAQDMVILILIMVVILGPFAFRNMVRRLRQRPETQFIPGRDCRACGGWGRTADGSRCEAPGCKGRTRVT